MISEDKYREMARRLLEKSRANEVGWKVVVPTDLFSKPNAPPSLQRRSKAAFQVTLPKSKIVLTFVSPPTESDFILLSILGTDGVEVDSWKIEEGTPDWELAMNLYSDARRVTGGWDDILKDVEQAIAKEGVIGR